MNIRELKIFKVLSEELNFTKTAERLNMTQPAVSHVIKDLEAELGAPLFDRLNRRIYLNAAGKMFLTKVVRLLEMYKDLTESFALGKLQQPLRVGSCLTIANFWLPQIVKEFNAVVPQTPLLVTIDRATHIEKLLSGNEIDIALYEGVVPDQQYQAEEFSSYEVSYIASPEHPLANQKNIPLAKVLGYDLLLREKGSAIRDTLDSALLLHNLKAEPVWTSVNSQALIQGALRNVGISVLPEIIAGKELEHGKLVKLKVDSEPMINHNYLLYHPGKYLTPPMRILMDIIRSQKDLQYGRYFTTG